uniref:DNA/RNA non-specific endonuclease/pyrophosphatase/phosphodiesterase domain-containing protein n=1 Tax=Globisporangium ultimum (strain ATCC 200006 / CBS 805.95 / DAOM BR144) TaxID=431595 RepID=K3WR66_GLOUD
MQWSYTFDARLRVESVVPSRSITRGDIGVRADSPDGFQDAFRAIMQVPVGSGTDAGHLVAASLKPPNWFFNYVPQHKKSNQGGGCWYNTEEAAKALVRLDCLLTYNVGLTYPATAPIATADSCKSSFRPTKMSLDLRITSGTGACATMADEWRGRSLVTYTAGTNELETTRLMAHTLHRAVFSAAANDLSGLLHFATTSAAVNQCDADTGAIYAFTSLKLTPEFTSATLLRGTDCLASYTDGAHTILDFDAADCKLWNTENTAKPDDLSDDAGLCITMVLVDGTNVLATLTSAASGGCLKFIYEFDPFAAIPAPPVVHTPPASGTISTTTPTALMARPVDALLTGLIGTIDGMSGEMEECLVWNAALRGFQLTNGQAGRTHADCLRVQVSHTQ